MKGKNKCKILKEIRQKIAEENDIPYVTSECTYKGECKGTCPKCEAELRYLEQELEKRRSLGRTVAVAAVAATLSFSLTACVPGGGSGGSQDPSQPASNPPATSSQDGSLQGRFPAETDPTQEILAGKAIPTTEPEELEGEPIELAGDVAYIPESTEEPQTTEIPETTEAR